MSLDMHVFVVHVLTIATERTWYRIWKEEGERKGGKQEAEWNSKSNVTNNMNRNKGRNSTDYMCNTSHTNCVNKNLWEFQNSIY